MVMVNIAEMKARLSHYLRAVRAGEDVVVADRDRPVARLVPYQERDRLRLEIVLAVQPARGLAELHYPRAPLRGLASTDLLIAERNRQR